MQTYKAAAYARYSSDNQREESIEAQLRAIREYCKKNNIQIIKIYTDEARSATTDDRPGFLQMIQDSALGMFDAVIVHKLDRFSRDRYDSAFYKRQLKKNGIRLISVLEPLDDSPESIILESVLEGMAEYYSANLARETLKGLKENAFECRHNGGLPPLGYDVDPVTKKYIVNENEAEAVKMIFEMYASGEGYNTIIDKLNMLEYKTKRGKTFGKNSIHEILRNEKYTGVYIYNSTARKVNGKYNSRKRKPDNDIIRIPGGMPRIIEIEIWKKVQDKMDKNKHAPGHNSAKEIYLLSGIIYCGKCGSAMVGNRKFSKGKKYVSYECSERKRKRTCDMKSIQIDTIENTVIDNLINNVFTEGILDKLANKVYDYAMLQAAEISSDIRALEAKLNQVETEIKNIVDAIAAGMFHASMKEKLNELEMKKVKIAQTLNEARLQAEINTPSLDAIKAYLQKDADIINKSPEEKKRIIHTYVKKIIVHNDTTNIVYVVDLSGCGRGI